jgi:hypothetical protein
MAGSILKKESQIIITFKKIKIKIKSVIKIKNLLPKIKRKITSAIKIKTQTKIKIKLKP